MRWICPKATRACEHEAVWLDEAVFRAGPKGVDDAVAAIKKIQRNAKELNAGGGGLRMNDAESSSTARRWRPHSNG